MKEMRAGTVGRAKLKSCQKDIFISDSVTGTDTFSFGISDSFGYGVL